MEEVIADVGRDDRGKIAAWLPEGVRKLNASPKPLNHCKKASQEAMGFHPLQQTLTPKDPMKS